jgi:deoxyribose-phosphate aldolase
MQLASYIDHSYLRPDCTEDMIDQLLAEANTYGFKAVCIPPMYLDYAVRKTESRSFLFCTVAGFPIGYDHIAAKLASIKRSAELGADEVDVVINLSAVKTAHWDFTRREMQSLLETSRDCGVLLKFIIEAQLLLEDEILRLCEISNELGVAYVKSSTGFFGEPVHADTVKLLRRHLDPSIQIKASGGITTFHQALSMIRAGADRLGCSQSVQIVKDSIAS